MPISGYLICFYGILKRELTRFMHQHSRFIAALIRPMVWLFIFAAGLRSALEFSNTLPYEGTVLYEIYIIPGLIGMILLFSSMQSALSIVYDKEMGSMRALLVSPFPRSFLLVSKLFSGVIVAMVQAYVFIAITWLWGLTFPLSGLIYVFPTLLLGGMLMASLGLLISSIVKQLENFAGVMNFIIFPLFFASSGLYPLAQMKKSSIILYQIASLNPFTHMVELIRYALYGKLNELSLGVVILMMCLFLGLALMAYNPSQWFVRHKSL